MFDTRSFQFSIDDLYFTRATKKGKIPGVLFNKYLLAAYLMKIK